MVYKSLEMGSEWLASSIFFPLGWFQVCVGTMEIIERNWAEKSKTVHQQTGSAILGTEAPTAGGGHRGGTRISASKLGVGHVTSKATLNLGFCGRILWSVFICP